MIKIAVELVRVKFYHKWEAINAEYAVGEDFAKNVRVDWNNVKQTGFMTMALSFYKEHIDVFRKFGQNKGSGLQKML